MRKYKRNSGAGTGTLDINVNVIAESALLIVDTILGICLLLGSLVKFKMIQYLRAPRPHRSLIDDLTLFEQQVNLMNGPVILLQLLRILDPRPLHLLFSNVWFCWTMEALVLFTVSHRAVGGTIIAGVRYVISRN